MGNAGFKNDYREQLWPKQTIDSRYDRCVYMQWLLH